MTRTQVWLGALLLSILIPFVLFAAEFRTGEQPSLSSGETVNDDVYIAGGAVSSAGTVQGDLIAAGGSVLVSGPVAGDILAGSGNLTITGNVADDVRAGGGNVIVQGTVGGDVILAGGQITLAGENVGGDAAIAGGTVRIDAPVGGGMRIAGGSIYLNAPVAGNVDIQAETITLGPRADIAGNFSYSAPRMATLEDGAVVRGETTFTERAGRADVERGAMAAFAAFATLWVVAKFFMILAGALVFALFFTRYSREITEAAMAQPLLEFGRGVIALIVLPVFSIILLATVIGIPLGAIGLLTFMAVIIALSLVAPVIIGAVVHKWIWKPMHYEVNWKTVLLGVAIYSVIGLVPILGGLVIWITKTIVFGAMLNIKWRVLKEWR